MTTEAFPFRHRFTEAVPLARGAEGRLLRVRDNWTGRWGALKVSVDASARQGLLEEFRWLSHLRHPCLIESHDLLEEDGERAHLLEYLPAVDPFRLWEDGGEEAVWAASTQTLRALAYLHRHGVVHGDVTPGNILVWREGSGWRAKLADLGLALPEASAAKAGVRGTPGYWSPEIAAGKGATPASDFYSLAASMYAWIEGRRPWSDLAPAEELRHLASMPDLPKPRRRISPELESFLAVLGSSRAEARSRWDWAELRSRTAAWGPPAIVATVSGLEAPVSEWKAWVHAVPMGSAAALVLSGRLGTGRRTALYALARALATEGWMTLWSSPMGVLHDRFAEAGSDLDPVVAARELGNRCAGRHLAFLWSDRATDLESRILRAFVAAREDASSNVRTLVLRAAGIEGSDEVVEWLRGTARCRADAWRGLDAEALRAISADLFAPEEGFVRRGESIETPLTLVAMKQAAVQGTGVGEAGAETHSEMERLWKRVSVPAREALLLLAESSLGWEAGELGAALGWTDEKVRNHLEELGRLGLIHRTFEAGTERNLIADALTREAVLRLGGRYETTRMKKLLEDAGGHPGDLELARHFWKRAEALPRYTLACLDIALREGRYEEVLDFAKDAGTRPEAFGDEAVELWSRFLRAATRLGKYEIEVTLLRQVIAWCEGPQEIAYRKALAQSLTNLGDWKQALEECRVLESHGSATDKDRIWAKLQRAETLWQAGQFAEADDVYARVESLLTDAMKEEWLRYGVGRARQHGQRGDMAGVKRYLDLTRDSVGEDVTNQDPLFLHTFAGISIQESGFELAQEVAEEAREAALEQSDWMSYMMTSLRSAAIAYGIGNMWEAARQGREALVTSAMLGSEVVDARAIAFLAYPETHLGNLASALRRARKYREIAEVNENKTLLSQSSRLLAFVGAYGGWSDLVEEARSFADRDEVSESSSFVQLCDAQFRLGLGDYDGATKLLAQSAMDMELLGERDSELHARLLLFYIDQKASIKIHESDFDRFPALKLLVRLVMANKMQTGGSEIFSETGAHLWKQGRFMELIEWFPVIFNGVPQSERQILKTRVINVIQRAANSLDDQNLRREFLEFPRTRRVLLLVREK